MSNPLLEMDGLPPFSRIRPEHVEPAVDQTLAANRARLRTLLDALEGQPTWERLVAPIEAMEERLSRLWSPARHLNAVMNNETLREAYNDCLPKLSEYATELGQHEGLYRAFRAVAETTDRLDGAQRKILDNALRDFRLSGVTLSEAGKARFRAIMQELSTLSSRFEDNVLDATHAWRKHVTDESRLAGLPESDRALARQAAQREGLKGWLFTLEMPSYLAVMTHAADRALRREAHEAYVTRASDQGPHAGRFDNTEVMERILALRHEAARLLGFHSYADYSLATKMARSPKEVLEFLDDLAQRSRPAARRELDELERFARERDGIAGLEAWDVAYYAERLKEQTFSLTQEELKPYFPAPRVLRGLFDVVERLYGIRIEERAGIDAWHPDVRFFEIRDAEGAARGQFYVDLYARPHKRGGAWMDECINRWRRPEGDVDVPVAYLTCNFSPPVGDEPALLTHDEVVTLFHEFGHGLHHMLTRVDHPSVAGINGVEWDAVELPSQLMENWCWQREALDVISGHYRTGEPLPDELFARLDASRTFHAAMQMVRQLEFALFDFRIHAEYDVDRGGCVYDILNEVRDHVAVVRQAPFNRFAHGFTHIFGGGYAAGYYSYKWAEVLSADAFAAFEEAGIFDSTTGRRFLEAILEKGGSRDAMDSFVAFRGREPTIEALLRHSGLAA
ncbi:MAG: oligopeptidase A [Gammaproteobacteria bacterium]|nr:oligopeptidase A [Gammaproteobacteria bacterium]